MDHTTRCAREEELLPARMLCQYAYCPRLFHLEWVQKEWAESADTLAGTHDHRRVDREAGDLPDPTELPDREGGAARSVTLSAPETGIVAKLDLIEFDSKVAVPVDYKHGKGPDDGDAVWPSHRIQIGSQAVALLENGYSCDHGVIYYAGSRRRVRVPVDDALLTEIRDLVQCALSVDEASEPPPPLVDSPKCPRCSLVGICLPDETASLRDTAESPPVDEVRRLYPARDDAVPLYVQAQGARVGKSGDQLEVQERDKGKEKFRLLDVSQVSLFGNVQITAGAIASLLERGIPVCHFSYGGWFRGITHGLGARNSFLKLAQYRVAADPDHCLCLARGFVARKILNCRTLLRRNTEGLDAGVLETLQRQAADAEASDSAESLLGIEGSAARLYFKAFSTMLRNEPGVNEFDFQGRNRRPPTDPVNALLSLAYSVLSRDWMIALLAASLDPFLGFYHRPRHGRPALALDLMEEFRPLIADSVTIQLINNGEVRPQDFLRRGPGVALTATGRKKFFLAYERRMGQLVRHPIFGYRVSYRRLLEVQARLLGRHLGGELASYDGFRTR